MIARLFNRAHVLFQPTDDHGMNEIAIGASVDDSGRVLLTQEDRHINVDPASVPELCRLLRRLQKEGR